MKKTSIAVYLVMILSTGLAQNQVELRPFMRWDDYPPFDIAYSPVLNSSISMKGNSLGVGLNYMHLLKDKLYIKVGPGYYKYSFNKIETSVPIFGTGKSRSINYPGGTAFAYTCNKYWYHTISLTVGLEKWFSVDKGIDLAVGIDVLNYFTLSQVYKIPTSSDDIVYKEKDSRFFGFGFNIHAGIQKEIGRFHFGPTIGLPIFSLWKQDSVFPYEQNNQSRNKWLNGFELGVSCKYSLTKNLLK